MEDIEMNNKQFIEDEINFFDILNKLWQNKKIIFKVVIIFGLIGLISAISTPNIYTSTCTMVPQSNDKKANGSLSGLAAMAGINLGSINSGEVLSPIVYPKIMANINFQKELIYSKYHFKEINEPITLYEFYTNEKYQKFSLIKIITKYSIGLPKLILKAFKSKANDSEQYNNPNIKSITKKESDVLKIISDKIALDVNSKDGYISLTVSMPEPLLAAELTQKGVELLQKYITEFKVEKVAQNLMFVESNFEEGKRNFESKQVELAKFRDANKSFSTSIAKTQEEMLLSEYNLLLGIYTELAKQREQAKIAVTETTPIFTIIEPVLISNEKSKPNRAMILILFIFLGNIFGICLVFTIPYLKVYFPNLNQYWFIPTIY